MISNVKLVLKTNNDQNYKTIELRKLWQLFTENKEIIMVFNNYLKLVKF